MNLIVDVSSNQSSVDLAKLRGYGVAGVWHKATEGLTYNDKNFSLRRDQAEDFGVRFGAYHYARPDLHPYDADGEAKHFCAVVGKVGRNDLRPALDLEVSAAFHKLSPAQLVEWARTFNRGVVKRLGVGPLFYSYPAYISRMAPRTPIGYGLWLAAFSRDDGYEHAYSVPEPWRKASAHQFTSNAHIPGVVGRCDVSSFKNLRPLLSHPWLSLL